jgi:hypothetical protein
LKKYLAFYKKSGKPWTKDEYENILHYVGEEIDDYEDLEKDFNGMNKSDKWIYYADFDNAYYAWGDSRYYDESKNNSKCTELAYEDIFEQSVDDDIIINNRFNLMTTLIDIPMGSIIKVSSDVLESDHYQGFAFDKEDYELVLVHRDVTDGMIYAIDKDDYKEITLSSDLVHLKDFQVDDINSFQYIENWKIYVKQWIWRLIQEDYEIHKNLLEEINTKYEMIKNNTIIGMNI